MIWEHLRREYRKFYSKEEEECCKDISQEDKKKIELENTRFD